MFCTLIEANKGAVIPTVSAKMLSCKLLSTAAVFVIHMISWKYPMPSHARTLCRTSLKYGEQPNAIARQLTLCHIFI
jgi:hypothetical protein